MTMKSCENCGIAIMNNVESVECFKFGKKSALLVTEKSCTYHIDIKYEDGEAMTPLQHLLLKEQELKARKMKGVTNCMVAYFDDLNNTICESSVNVPIWFKAGAKPKYTCY